MNHGPLIFLGIFFALAASWFGLVFEPQLQLGNAQPTNAVNAADLYPQMRPGMARQGLAATAPRNPGQHFGRGFTCGARILEAMPSRAIEYCAS